MQPVGLLVQESRRAVGLTQRELADAAGISLSSLRDLEQGRTHCPRWGTLENLASVLGMGQRQRAELLGAERVGPDVRIGILGTVEAARSGRPAELGSVRQRAVLGLLVLHRDGWLHRDAIIDVLWGERPAASAVAEVQGYVSRLRGLLDPGRLGGRAGLITCMGQGYQLVAGAARIDAAEFAAGVRRADAALAAADPGGACAEYERALALWRGEPAADVHLLRGHPAVAALGSLRADAVLGYARAAVQAGRVADALPHLRGLCAAERFNERAHACLMIALAASGQQGAALDVFADVRGRLDRELGIRPSAALAGTHVRVLRQQLGTASVALASGHGPG
jgi:DNA-binding SARP family transcriptional activator/DNA-binding XRE family transcriptional regulator